MVTANRMTPERWALVKELLAQALEMNPAQRPAYIESACGDDTLLRNEMMRLLAAEERAGVSFLREPASVDSLRESDGEEGDRRKGQILGSYRLLSVIGEGGMGAVYRAVRADEQYESQVAIKLVHAGQDSPFVTSRFRNERQILAGLDHPNIARLLDGGTTEEGVPYFVMELIEGEAITDYCDNHQLSIDERLKLFLQVCSAVQYAHRRLIVHRDIKPRNILVTPEGVPKLLDFGIAKIIDPTMSENVLQTAMSLRVFTPAYASPEQVRGEPITTASDVYSLGIVLYEMLTGHPAYPLDTRTPEAISHAVCEYEPQRLSTIVQRTEFPAKDRSGEITPEDVSAARACSPEKLSSRLTGDLDKIVLMSLRKEPDRRYGSVDQFAEDIRRHLVNLPVVAQGDAVGYRAWKFVKRHRAGIASAAIASLALMVGTVVAVREARVARAERARAERRFNDVRKLANSLMFDIHDAIRELPGSTPARRLLLGKALEYLDSLSGEASNDGALLRELATAYERVAEVQGHYLNDNLGDTEGSLRSYQKGLTIREQLIKTPAGTWEDRVALANSYRNVASQMLATGDVGNALSNVQRAVALSEGVLKDHPKENAIFDELSYDYEIQAQVLGAYLDDTGVSTSCQKAVDTEVAWLGISPDNINALHSYQIDLMFLADSLKAKGNIDEANKDYETSLELAKRVSQRTDSARRLRDVAIVENRLGQISETRGDWGKALDHYQEALEIYKQLVAREPADFMMKEGFAIAQANVANQNERLRPRSGLSLLRKSALIMENSVRVDKKNARARDILSYIYTALGEALWREGRIKEALVEYQKAESIHELLRAGDPHDRSEVQDLASCRSKIAGLLLALGDVDGASKEFSQALELLAPFLTRIDVGNNVLRTAADSFAGLGDIELKQAKGGRTLELHLRKARELYLKSLAAWEKDPPALRNSHEYSSQSSPQSVQNKMRYCEERLKKEPS